MIFLKMLMSLDSKSKCKWVPGNWVIKIIKCK